MQLEQVATRSQQGGIELAIDDRTSLPCEQIDEGVFFFQSMYYGRKMV